MTDRHMRNAHDQQEMQVKTARTTSHCWVVIIKGQQVLVRMGKLESSCVAGGNIK